MYISGACYPVVILRRGKVSNPYVHLKDIGDILHKLFQKAEKSHLYKLLHKNRI